jgi:O-antigen/teichoic acid export membrane protein
VLLRRSAAIMAGAQIPAAVVVAAGSGLLLRLFGGSYADRAQALVVAFAVAALAVALNTWTNFALKLTRQMGALLLCNTVYAVVAIGCALLWAPKGLVWLGWAWGAGNLVSGLVALVALAARRRRRTVAVEPPGQRRPQTMETWT